MNVGEKHDYHIQEWFIECQLGIELGIQPGHTVLKHIPYSLEIHILELCERKCICTLEDDSLCSSMSCEPHHTMQVWVTK